MSEVDTHLGEQLERALDGLPAAPPTSYLRLGRRKRWNRRAVRGLMAAAVVSVLGGSLMLLDDDTRPSALDPAQERPPATAMPTGPDPDYVAPEPANQVAAVDGLEGVDAYSTDTVPRWAEEYGNHGPVDIAADGRLWVAPDAVITRTVVDPVGRGEHGDVKASYAVEAEFPAAEGDGELVWVIIYADADGSSWGEMQEPGDWTDDFELWVDDVTAALQGRPSFAERLVHFAGEYSQVLEPADGVELVRQLDDVDRAAGWRSSVAEVRWSGKTWFVLAGGSSRRPWYRAYDPAIPGTDLDGFVRWLGNGLR